MQPVEKARAIGRSTLCLRRDRGYSGRSRAEAKPPLRPRPCWAEPCRIREPQKIGWNETESQRCRPCDFCFHLQTCHERKLTCSATVRRRRPCHVRHTIDPADSKDRPVLQSCHHQTLRLLCACARTASRRWLVVRQVLDCYRLCCLSQHGARCSENGIPLASWKHIALWHLGSRHGGIHPCTCVYICCFKREMMTSAKEWRQG